jgi:hypothetical protein
MVVQIGESGTPKSIGQEKEHVALISDAIVLSSRFGAQWKYRDLALGPIEWTLHMNIKSTSAKKSLLTRIKPLPSHLSGSAVLLERIFVTVL